MKDAFKEALSDDDIKAIFQPKTPLKSSLQVVVEESAE
jgi:hypothetical protein